VQSVKPAPALLIYKPMPTQIVLYKSQLLRLLKAKLAQKTSTSQATSQSSHNHLRNVFPLLLRLASVF